uniref:Uncharacterized protein n=1 Tax=Peronospora matthiolae TaxID=2874970 RepID=A0AAV1UW75_9STRA
MLRGRNLFALQARRGPTERVQTLTLLVHVREQDLSHFNGRSGTAGAQRIARLVELLDRDEAFQALVQETDDVPRQLEQRVKSKGKDETHTFELSDVTIQWQVADESGLPCVLQRVQSGSDGAKSWGRNTAVGSVEATGKYRPLPVRQLVVAVWMYPPHVEVVLTEERTPVSDVVKQDFFADMDKDNDSVDEDLLEDCGDSR